MAAPNVAGVLARYRALYPSKTVAQIRAAVQATAIDIEAPGKDNNTGYGLLDAYELLTGQPSPARNWVTAPGEPTNLRATPGNRSVGVTWGAPAFTGGSAVAGYVVQVVSASDEAELWLGASARSATVTGLVNGRAYRVYVTAYNSDWYGNPAIGPSVTPRPPTVPAAPAIGTATPGNASTVVRWSAAANNGSAVTSYTVKAYRGSTLVKTLTVAGSATSVQVTGLANGHGHTFTVTARNGVGYGPSSARSANVVPRTVPSAPRIGSAAAGASAAVVRWAAPTSNGGAAVTGYQVRVYRGSTLVKTVTVGASSTSATVGGLARRVGSPVRRSRGQRRRHEPDVGVERHGLSALTAAGTPATRRLLPGAWRSGSGSCPSGTGSPSRARRCAPGATRWCRASSWRSPPRSSGWTAPTCGCTTSPGSWRRRSRC